MFDDLYEKRIKLDNGMTYQVIWSTSIDNRNFYYLLNQDNLKDIHFCEAVGEGQLKDIEDKEFLEQVLIKMSKEINTFAK